MVTRSATVTPMTTETTAPAKLSPTARLQAVLHDLIDRVQFDGDEGARKELHAKVDGVTVAELESADSDG